MAERAAKRSASSSHGERPPNRRTMPPKAVVPLSSRMRDWRERARLRLGWLRRGVIWMLHLALAGAVLVALLFAGKLIERHLRTAAGFATTAIEIRGHAHLKRADIERIAGLAIGKNIFEVSPEEASARLLAEPWIASADVRRFLPGTYTIQVSERRAVALLALDDLYLVSEEALAFKKLGPGDPADLPLITGIELSSVAQDKRGTALSLVNAVAFLREYASAGVAKSALLSEIHIELDETLSCYVGSDATYVRLGAAPYRGKLKKLREVLSQLASQSARASYVYLDNERRPDRVTVKLR
jgi:cell division protein FtsQ